MQPGFSVAPNQLSARLARQAILAGQLRSVELVEACLARIAIRDGVVGAWCYLDGADALRQAREADQRQCSGTALGVLHGLPIGIKDVFDTFDMPSEYGSASLAGRRPGRDADAVELLRGAGAIILGKTTTTEFGVYADTSCRNPLDLDRSPGVSSAGSAAAVADRMVPLALGTQHTASTLLPASFCGVCGFKPSFAFTSMRGSNVLVPRLANIGFLARDVDDLALFASAFAPQFDVPVPVHPPRRLAWVQGPACTQVSVAAKSALAILLHKLPMPVDRLELPAEFDRAFEVTHGLLSAHLADRFGNMPSPIQDRYCAPLREAMAIGSSLDAATRIGLDAEADRLVTAADGLFASCDAFITLAALGEAGLRSAGPGSGAMTVPWSLAGLPSVSLPLLQGEHGLPIGVQLVGPRGHDAGLLSIAAWLTDVAAREAEAARP
jgi:Asp-tRNA(Asn)/Glu-tRNA(Gln) amidotransferase A subunit family amidase